MTKLRSLGFLKMSAVRSDLYIALVNIGISQEEASKLADPKRPDLEGTIVAVARKFREVQRALDDLEDGIAERMGAVHREKVWTMSGFLDHEWLGRGVAMTDDEINKIAHKLMDWFEGQALTQPEATRVLMVTIAAIISSKAATLEEAQTNVSLMASAMAETVAELQANKVKGNGS